MEIVFENGRLEVQSARVPMVEKSVSTLKGFSPEPTCIRVSRGDFSTHIAVSGVWTEGEVGTDFHVESSKIYWTHSGHSGDWFKSFEDAYQSLLRTAPLRDAKAQLERVSVAMSDRKNQIVSSFDLRYPPKVGYSMVTDYTGATGRSADSGSNSVCESYVSRTPEEHSLLQKETQEDGEILTLAKQKKLLGEFITKFIK